MKNSYTLQNLLDSRPLNIFQESSQNCGVMECSFSDGHKFILKTSYAYRNIKIQEAMENFVFPDNLQDMPIFCQMA